MGDPFMAGYLAITNRLGELHDGKQIPRIVWWFGGITALTVLLSLAWLKIRR